ncbi:MAG TPA: hypothetical protein VK705_08885 [Ferruginibacter sp.]|jgi:hypothetical protein|nr:hypothetical protein [Ferruginibacter sp.]
MNKRHSISIILIGFSIMSIVSCKKKSSSNYDNGTVLTKFVRIDTSLHAPLDTLYKLEFQYDNLGRLSSYTNYIYNATASAADSLEESVITTFTYNSSGVNPTGSIILNQQSNNTFAITYSYDSNSNLTFVKEVESGSSISEDSDIVYYSYSGNTTKQTRFFYYGGNVIGSDTTVYQQTVQNNNIATAEIFVNSPSAYSHNFTPSYDSHNNPFYAARMIYFASVNVEDETGGYFGGSINDVSVNNVVSCIDNASFGTFPYLTSGFVYNADGYPISSNYTSTDNGYHSGIQYYYYSN